jgi:hypothetical protein
MALRVGRETGMPQDDFTVWKHYLTADESSDTICSEQARTTITFP